MGKKMKNTTVNSNINVFDDDIVTNLSDRHKAFALEYIRTLHARNSYKKVYGDVTDSTADVNSSRLLSSAKIKSFISEVIESYRDNIGIELGEVIGELKKIAFTEKDVSVGNRLKALEMLGKNQSAFTQKIELSTEIKDTSTINIEAELDSFKLIESDVDDSNVDEIK